MSLRPLPPRSLPALKTRVRASQDRVGKSSGATGLSMGAPTGTGADHGPSFRLRVAVQSRGSDTPEASGRPDQKKDRKSTRLNSSHLVISYAVFCLKKKKNSKDRST